MTVLLDGIVKIADDLLAGWVGLNVFEVFGHSFAGDGQAIAVKKSAIEEHLHERSGAPMRTNSP